MSQMEILGIGLEIDNLIGDITNEYLMNNRSMIEDYLIHAIKLN